MIRIKVHRGTHQIGGCATEIEYDGERILIDLGANLPGVDDEAAICDKALLDSVFGRNRDRHFDAILFTHYHGDHYGLYKEIPEGIPMYMGKTAKEILHIVTGYMDLNAEKKGRKIIDRMKAYKKGCPIDKLQKMKVIPFTVDHSALDAYMFLIEVEEKKILFTGDFRDHGIASEREQLWRVLDKYVGEHIDVIMTEGTMLSRVEEADNNIVQTEKELGQRAMELFTEKKYNFVMVSSTNLDSIMEFYHNTPDEKLFICDQYQARVLLTAMENKGKEFAQYRSKREKTGLYKKICIIGNVNNYIYRNLQKRGEALKKQGLPQVYLKKVDSGDVGKLGFVMLVRPNRFFEQNGYSKFEELYRYFYETNPDNVNLIYSMWKGYLSGDKADVDVVRFIGELGEWKYTQLHTSGHAYVETIQRLLGKVHPDMIIPMHTEMADEFAEMKQFADYKDKVYILNDGEELAL